MINFTIKMKRALLGLSLFACTTVFAQDYTGYSIGSWAGINSLHLNPANVVDSRYKVDINLVGINAFVSNNAMSINQKYLFSKARWEEPIDPYVTYYTNQDRTKNALVNLRIQGPSFMFNITKKDAIGVVTNLRMVSNVNDVENQIFNYIVNGIPVSDYYSNGGGSFSNPYTTATANAWAEYGIAYGRVLYAKEKHFLKMGVTVKLLQGLGMAYASVKNAHYTLEHDTFRTVTGNLNYGHSDNIGFGENENDFKFKFAGLGFGGDIGFVYEWRPNYEKYQYEMDGEKGLWRRDLDPYKLKFSIAANDIGAISYNRGKNSHGYKMDIKDLPTSYFNGTNSVYELTKKLQGLSGNGLIDTNVSNTKILTSLPTTLVASLDYQVVKGFYLNLTPQIAFLTGRATSAKVHTASSIMFTVRYENEYFGAYMPIGYNFASQFMWGLSLRLGPIFVGTGNLFSNLIAGDWKSLDVHAGVRIPITHGAPKDRDNDKVSDKKDRCIDVPGVWEFRGCPDTDGDGIQDSEDECPTEPGLKEFNGCPDTDGDGIPDKDDKCPTEAGPKELGGCPDRDGDGIIDSEDECPDEKGLREFNGCPDRDGDGIPDKDDKCPDHAGPKETFGCPDSDGDGVYDFEDDCPNEKGSRENRGCPYADRDGDGIRDIDDKCPDLPGPIENGGCPYSDTDGDGVIDKEDRCPNTPGPKENNGCPVIEKEEQEVLKEAFDNLEFATGKSVIKVSSYASLDKLADLLKKKPEYKLLIEGHTDNVGSRANNITLSKNRANAVKTYLMKQGVGASRFVVEWYGPDKPIDDNKTEEGRQRNRRVEMSIIMP